MTKIEFKYIIWQNDDCRRAHDTSVRYWLVLRIWIYSIDEYIADFIFDSLWPSDAIGDMDVGQHLFR